MQNSDLFGISEASTATTFKPHNSGLDLSRRGLKTWPVELFNLRQLESLDLSLGISDDNGCQFISKTKVENTDTETCTSYVFVAIGLFFTRHWVLDHGNGSCSLEQSATWRDRCAISGSTDQHRQPFQRVLRIGRKQDKLVQSYLWFYAMPVQKRTQGSPPRWTCWNLFMYCISDLQCMQMQVMTLYVPFLSFLAILSIPEICSFTKLWRFYTCLQSQRW